MKLRKRWGENGYLYVQPKKNIVREPTVMANGDLRVTLMCVKTRIQLSRGEQSTHSAYYNNLYTIVPHF